MKTPPGRGPGASDVFDLIRRAGATGGWQRSLATKNLDGESHLLEPPTAPDRTISP